MRMVCLTPLFMAGGAALGSHWAQKGGIVFLRREAFKGIHQGLVLLWNVILIVVHLNLWCFIVFYGARLMF